MSHFSFHSSKEKKDDNQIRIHGVVHISQIHPKVQKIRTRWISRILTKKLKNSNFKNFKGTTTTEESTATELKRNDDDKPIKVTLSKVPFLN